MTDNLWIQPLVFVALLVFVFICTRPRSTKVFGPDKLCDHKQRYATDNYRVVPGSCGRPVLQRWIQYPNYPMSEWVEVNFRDCHTLLEAREP